MTWNHFWHASALAVALSVLALLPAPSDARDDKTQTEKIAQWIQQLGSDSFAERNAASKALDEIGEPALEALREAMKSRDAEVRRRATALVATIEARTQSGRILSPKMVELKYKDTPLSEALADFSKQSGYALNLIDPSGKLKSKKITLTTGKVTFWEALEKFKVAAELDEADPAVLMRLPGGPGVGGPGFVPPPPPAIGFAGGAPGFGAVPMPAPVPAVPPAVIEKIKEAIKRPAVEPKEGSKQEKKQPEEQREDDSVASEDQVADEKPAQGAAAGGSEPGVVPGAAGGGAAGAAQPGLVPGAPGAIQVDPVPPDANGPGGPGWNPVMNLFQHGKINLIAAKPAPRPSDTRSSVRVRALPTEGRAAMPFPMLAAGKKNLTVLLQATPEPRLRFQQLTQVTIEKAIDDNDQQLTQAKPMAPNAEERDPAGGGGGGGIGGAPGGVFIGGPGGFGVPGFPGGGIELFTWSNDGLSHNFPVLLTPGAKPSKKLKELSGTLSAKFLADPFPAIEVAEVMKAKGKTVRGSKGGSVTIKDVTKAADGTITIAFEFDQPADLVAETGNFQGGVDVPVPGIGIVPVPLPAPAPPVAPPPPPDGAPGGGEAPVEAPPAKPAPGKRIEGDDEPIAQVGDEEKPADDKPAKPIQVQPGVGIGGGIAIGGGGGIVIGGPAIGGPAVIMPFPGVDGNAGLPNMNGLSLQDDKGKTLPAHIQIDWKKVAADGVINGVGPGQKAHYLATYRPVKGGPKEPSKLVFTARRVVEVAIPFTLKDVPLK